MKISDIAYVTSDVIDFLESLDGSNFFDMVYADPYFNVGSLKSETGDSMRTEYLQKIRDEDYFEWCREWLKLLGKKMKAGAHLYLGCVDWAIPTLWNILKDDYWLEPNTLLIWHKPNVANLNKLVKDFLFDCEFLIFASKGKARPVNNIGIPENRHALWNISTPVFSDKEMKEQKVHPCQRPIELCRRMVRYSTKEGELVYDMFSGSGVMLLACKQLNRDCIGTDIDSQWKDYYMEIAGKTTSILEYAE